MVSESLPCCTLVLLVIQYGAAAPKGMMSCRTQRVISIRPSVLPSEALHGLFEFEALLAHLRPSGPSQAFWAFKASGSPLRLPEAVTGSLKLYDAPFGPLGPQRLSEAP